MSMIGEDSSGQLISWRQQSLEKFVSQGGLIAAAPSTTTAAIRPLRFCKDPYTISHPIYATCGRIRCSKPALSISKAVLQISHQRTAHVATVSCPLHYRGRESNQGINIIAMDDRGEYLAVCSRSGFIRVYGGQALIEASYNR